MKILKRRDKLDKTITVRVPEAIKGELDQLRQRADAAGFDVGATLRESLIGTIRQIGAELGALETPSLDSIWWRRSQRRRSQPDDVR